MKEGQTMTADRGRNSAPRQSQDERSEATRKRLLDAAVKIILERGCAGLRSAEISEVAKVSRGGQLYHFPAKDTLVAAVLERILIEASDRTRRSVAEPRPKARLLEAVVQDAKGFFFSDEFRVVLDILMSSGNDPNMAEALRNLPKRLGGPSEDAWIRCLAEIGADINVARDLVWFLWSVVHGLAIRGFASRALRREGSVISRALELANSRLSKHWVA